MLIRSLKLFSLLALLTLQACSKQAPCCDAAIASAHPAATRAGIEILEAGGNAFDAAVAVTAALAVVEPYGSGIGGGGFWLLHDAASATDVMVDGRERAPGKAHRDMYLDESGEVIPSASIDGPLAAGIPGVPAALQHISEKYGKLPLERTLQPAISLAREGFAVERIYIRLAGFRKNALSASDDAAAIFLRDGEVPAAGEIIVQEDLANTLTLIASEGSKGFYTGELAERMVDDVQAHGGIWTLQDLADYRIIEREPIRFTYEGMDVVSVPPPSSGGVALAQILGIYGSLVEEGMSEPVRLHLLIESMRRAYRDRAEYLGDSDYYDVPVSWLISDERIAELAASVSPDRATPSDQLRAITVDETEGTDTTHFSIVDSDGNKVAATLSINYPFGSGFVPEGTGVLLNDEMDDFSSRPGTPNAYGLVGAEANAIEPGKRMLSSMSPTFASLGDRELILGTPGGSRIITMVLHGLLEFHGGGDADAVVSKPRFHHQYLPDFVSFEKEASNEAVEAALVEMGHTYREMPSTFGDMQAVIIDKRSGEVDAASDPRGIGMPEVIRRD